MGYSINDIARRSGFSKKTVSRVLNKEPSVKQSTRETIEAVIDELGFIPSSAARGLALGRNLLIALIHDNPNPQTVMNFQRGMLASLRDTDFAMAVDHVDRASPDLALYVQSFIARHRPSAVVFLPPISEMQELADVCERAGVACVRVGSARLAASPNVVWTRDREAVRSAVSTLIERGHTHWGLVRGPEGFRSAHERVTGFLEALEASGLLLDPEFDFTGEYTFESGRNAGRELASREFERITLFCCNDEMAAGLQHEIRGAGIAIPQQVALLGFDDSPTSRHVFPQISTLRWPIERMAQLAIERVLEQAKPSGEERGASEGLMPTFLERGSTG
ncbi:LacI family DNA-binding transcriptional regulator [Aurantiacibacter aquimixticola]|uniref:LacI family DNA-binding transcriptional regulator n=1 Tax=Aurantiacibacter aquimixticola TaxID=1958945 RepID=A0A419RU47_9SPHN|nr:LacI family DNA-binding transcriptional regulator [Aurantiacibacter aquimixticola]RJY09311.1 LacI family DNA-binding transcriptional regulator [Aurantiacibacter aquimixticola]